MRRTKKVGDWIAGFSSATLVENSCKKIPSQGLIYLAQISEVLAFEEYFTDSRFEKKKPAINGYSSVDTEAIKGDNIYFKNDHGILEQLTNANHDHLSISNDLGGKNVLISQKFYYFGENCRVPQFGWSSINCRIPDGRPTAYGYKNESSVVEKILAFLGERESEILPGIHGKPCVWKD